MSKFAGLGDASEYFTHREADYLSPLMGPAFAGKISPSWIGTTTSWWWPT
jgi:hypothetical protein